MKQVPTVNRVSDQSFAAFCRKLFAVCGPDQLLIVAVGYCFGELITVLNFAQNPFNGFTDSRLIHILKYIKGFVNPAKFFKRFVKWVLPGIGIQSPNQCGRF